ncbi:MAG: ankyrin repeat domain-containing protein [Fretibacterium sp.]|nr:ankyrin repeat domain-containing protein [Fretibacterium sp.]
MGKKLCAVMLCAVALATPYAALAKTNLKDVLIDVGVTILKEAIKNPGTAGRKKPDETQPEKPVPKVSAAPASRLSEAQYLEFVEICRTGSVKAFKAKLRNENISPNAIYERGMGYDFLLNIAAANAPDAKIIRFLTDESEIDVNQYQDDVPWPALFSAACREDARPEVMAALIEAGANVNAVGGDDGSSVLMFAAKSGTPEAVQILIDSGAEVNGQYGPYKYTALTAAALGTEKPEVIVTLLKAGADAGIKDSWGKFAVNYARENPSLKGTKALRMLEEASGGEKAPAQKTAGRKSSVKRTTRKKAR